MRLNFFYQLFIILLCAPLSHAVLAAVQLNDGDIIFHTSTSSQSVAIQLATDSKYSHMGLVFFNQGKPYVLEAAKTVRYTPLKQWIARGENQHYVIKRIKNSSSLMTSNAIEKLKQSAERFLNLPYDLYFGWSDDKIYCSELVWKAYENALNINVGQLEKLRDFDLSAPKVKDKLQERYRDHIPYNETVISPASIYNAKNLVLVESN